MIKATGSQIILKLLEMEGVKYVAGIPGGQILPLYDELNKTDEIPLDMNKYASVFKKIPDIFLIF